VILVASRNSYIHCPKDKASGHLHSNKNSSESQVDSDIALMLCNLKHTQIMFRLSQPIFLCHDIDTDFKPVFLFVKDISAKCTSRVLHGCKYQKYVPLECGALSFGKYLLFFHEGGSRFLRNVGLYLARIHGIRSNRQPSYFCLIVFWHFITQISIVLKSECRTLTKYSYGGCLKV
jgi:hypothetical protein